MERAKVSTRLLSLIKNFAFSNETAGAHEKVFGTKKGAISNFSFFERGAC